MMSTMSDRWYGWHFLPEDHRLRWGSHEVVEAGRTYRVEEGPLVLCENGMHASEHALDALSYAPGPVVCRVELLGERLDDADKSCARTRRVLWLADATTILHEFACTMATDALHFAEARSAWVDPRARAAIETKRRWLRGEATDAALHASENAAWSAAGAAWNAAGAVWNAAWGAAASAARSAESAARIAARSVTTEARSAQNVVLEMLLWSLAPSPK